MPTPARADQYSKTQADVVTLAHRELLAFWRTLDKSNPVTAKAALADFMVTLIDAYGPMSATFAADYYDEIRDDAKARGRFTASPSGTPPADQVRSSSDWASQPLFGELPDDAAALQRFIGSSQRLVQSAGRDTLVQNASRDPAKPTFARVPHGKTCEFCIMLASRGAVYRSAASAGESRDFHDECDCQPVPSFGGDDADLPYDLEATREQYAANQAATSGKKRPSKPRAKPRKAEPPARPNRLAKVPLPELKRRLAEWEAPNQSNPIGAALQIERLRKEIASRSK